jgi:hypothetical protein
MIAEWSVGTAAIPESSPGQAIDVVVKLQAPMPSASYEVLLLRAASIPLSDIKVKSKTATEVTVTITRPNGHAGAGNAVHVLCLQSAAQRMPAELVAQQAALDALKADVAGLKSTVTTLSDIVNKIKPPKP